ncbi:MAG: polyketide synthase, partial [Actinophytocola sp.]|uniref:beta-ketoacyl [acyl carrier protein] synthase domain-containing protein n=1 Tax=Actinophytocola sp. TaxID=1872138 RepID=UPI003D6BA4A9
MTSSEETATRVAVTGMAVRVPGCGGDLDGFWSALADGRELLTRAGSDAGAAHGVVPDGDLFDAEFFGYAPSEARLMDPQQRVFLECAWAALEHAGHAPGAGAHVVGVYAGCGDTGHLERLRAHRNGFAEVSDLQLHLASSVDFLTARVAYKLGLTGPACTVQAACATGLVAVHTATQALLAGECDMALAGGITLHVPFPHDQVGEDGIVAPDGHCRAYDADARGTVVSDGAGVVVLKRLDDALADGDHVHAVILGSAVTNDGADKVGFTAPSVQGVAAAADAALVLSGVQPSTVDYVEGHGTGTPAGDPIELRGLAKAYGAADPGTELLLGSVKSNIGHTDVAAGVLGLIKVVLAMRHETVPATLHFRTPNPAGDLASSPFRVNAGPVPWPRGAGVRRAGVNSLGLGGTNAHVVMEEAPAPAPAPPAGRPQLLPVSAGSHG